MILGIYVPTASLSMRGVCDLRGIADGSGIVGTPVDVCEVCGHRLTEQEVARVREDVDFVEHGDPAHLIRVVPSIRIDYEGGIYKQAGFDVYANRVFHAADRHVTNYPTVARRFVVAADLLRVGSYDTETRKIVVDNSEALAGWIGEYADDHLQVTL